MVVNWWIVAFLHSVYMWIVFSLFVHFVRHCIWWFIAVFLQVIPVASDEQLLLVELISSIKVLPPDTLIQTVRQVIKQPPPTNTDRNKVSFWATFRGFHSLKMGRSPPRVSNDQPMHGNSLEIQSVLNLLIKLEKEKHHRRGCKYWTETAKHKQIVFSRLMFTMPPNDNSC